MIKDLVNEVLNDRKASTTSLQSMKLPAKERKQEVFNDRASRTDFCVSCSHDLLNMSPSKYHIKTAKIASLEKYIQSLKHIEEYNNIMKVDALHGQNGREIKTLLLASIKNSYLWLAIMIAATSRKAYFDVSILTNNILWAFFVLATISVFLPVMFKQKHTKNEIEEVNGEDHDAIEKWYVCSVNFFALT